MLKIVVTGLLIFLNIYSYAKNLPSSTDTTKPQTKPPVKEGITEGDDDNGANTIFDEVEIDASFPGGNDEWRKYLQRTLNAAAPVENGAPAGTYTVIVQFIVDKEGNISDVKALTRHGYGMEAEVMRVIRKGPKWEPAIQNGRMVKAYRKQPVTFQVVEEKRKRKNKD
jgi:protein TonB